MTDESTEQSEKYVNFALKNGADEALIIIDDSHNRQVRFSKNEIDIINDWISETITIYITKNKKQIITTVSRADNAEERIKQSIKQTDSLNENINYNGIAKGSMKYRNLVYCRDIEKIEDPTDIVDEAINGALNNGAKSVGGTLYIYNMKRSLSSSEGPCGFDKSTGVSLSIRAFGQDDSSGHWVSVTPNLNELNPFESGKKAAEITTLQPYKQTKIEAGAGIYDVILSPMFTGSLISNISEMISAFSVEVGQTIFINKLNEVVAPDFVTFSDYADDGVISKRIFDDEGYPIQKTKWLEKGILKTYLHNTSTAKRFNVNSTGNAGLIEPTPFFTYMDAGDSTLNEMIKETKHGLYFTNTWYTRYQNMYTGDFSTIPRDSMFVIENGEIAGRCKNLRVSDNIASLLKNIELISKDRYQIQWWGEARIPSLSPYLKIKNVHITTSR